MKIKAKHIISALLSILLIYFLVINTDLSQLQKALVALNPGYYFVAMIFYGIGLWIRSKRTKEIFGNGNTSDYILFTGFQQLLNRVLPLRLGEVFFPVMIRNIFGNSYFEGVPKLIILRLLDLCSLFISFLLVLLIIDFNISKGYLLIISGVFVTLVLVTLKLKTVYNWISRIMTSLFPLSIGIKIRGMREKIDSSFNISYGVYLKLFFYSIADKLLNYVTCYLLLAGLHYDFSILEIVTANSMSGVTEILPVNSVGSFGTTELGWAGALIFFGKDKETAIASGFGFNILAFSFTIIYGVISYIALKFIRKISPLAIHA